MTHMRTRIFSILLTCAMLLSLLPATALAVSVGGTVERVQDTETWYSDATKAFDTRETYWNDQVTKAPESYSVDDSTKTVSIGSAEALVWWGKQVNGGTSFAGYTVNITADLNLSAHYWTPICTGTVSYSDDGKFSIANNETLEGTTINGNGHEIIGLATQTGVRGPNQDSQPGDGQNCYYDAAFIGYSSCNITIEDLTFDGARIAISEPFNEVVNTYGSSMLAVVVGAQSGGSLTLSDVTVNDADVLAMQKASAFVGNLMGGSTLTVDQCAITNSRFSAYFMVAPIASYGTVGQVSVNGIKLENNTVRVVEQSGSTYTYDEETGAEYWAGDLNACATALFSDGSSAAGKGTVWTPVAEVDGYLYDSLTAAVADARSGETVTLLRNAEENLPGFTSDKTLTLDLNTYTLTIPGSSSVLLKNGANLTIKNGAIVAKAFNDGTNALFNIQTGSAITLDDVDVDTTASALFPQGDAASVTVQNGSTIKCGVYAVGTNAATTDNYKVVITLKDSTFTSTYGYNTTYSKDSCPVMINVEGTLDIDNCTITGTRQGVIVRAGTATIDNSTIKSTGEYTYNYTGYPDKWGSGDEVPAAALVVGNYQNGAASAYLYEANVTLTNTTVIAENSIPALYVDANATYKGVVSISGSESYVSGAINNGQYADKEQISITITGGTFTSNPTDYLATGYEAQENTPSAGLWTVVEKADGGMAVTGTEVSEDNKSVSATLEGIYTNTNTDIADDSASSSNDAATGNNDKQGNLTVTLPEANGSTTAALNIPQNTANSLSKASSLTLESKDVGTVVLDDKALDAIAKADDDVTIEIKNDNGTYTVTAKAGSTNLLPADSGTNATVTISVPYTLDSSKTDVLVFWVDGTQPEPMKTTYSAGESGNAGTLTWTTPHLSEFMGVSYADTDEVVYFTSSNTTGTAGSLAAALEAVKSSGGTIWLLKDATLNDASYWISKGVAVKSAGVSQTTPVINATVPASGKCFTVYNTGSLVLEDINLKIQKAENATATYGIDVYHGATLTMNNVKLELKDLSNGTISSDDSQGEKTPGVFELNHSTITATNIGGNFSNGGNWKLTNGSKIEISGCTSHGLSCDSLTVDNSTVNVSGTGLLGVTAREIKLENHGQITVDSCGTSLPKESQWSTDGVSYKYPVEIKKNGSVSVDSTSAVELRNNTSGNTIYLVESNLKNSGTINAQVVTKAPDGAYTVTVMDRGTLLEQKTVSSSDSYTLPAAPAAPSGYTFANWLGSDGKTYAANTVVSNITANMTFTAQWRQNTIPTDPDNSSSPSGDYLVTVDKTTGGRVTVNPGRADKGDTVTITVKPNDGYVLDELTVTAKDGGSVKLTWKDDNKYTFTMPGSQVTVEATFVKEGGQTVDLPFADVAESDWYYDAVQYVYENDLMNGTSATTFSPFVTTSRAMILTILARYDGVDTSTGSTWYEAGAVWAIAEGVSDGTNLEANLTREQLVTMLWRYAGSPVVEADLADYPDSASVSDWAVNAIIWAVENGVITGNGAGALNPQGTATRAEVATILMRFIEK